MGDLHVDKLGKKHCRPCARIRRGANPRLGYIGEEETQEEYEFIPLPTTEPVHEPSPVEVPEGEPVPA